MFYSRVINQTMRILKAQIARLSNRSSATVSARFRNVVSRNVVEFHGRSYASSSVASELSTVPKVRRKVFRDERRALVESFVTRYRASNGGKFPTLVATHKEVGGGYYVVRDIYQELKFKSKNSPATGAPVLSERVAAAENDASVVSTDEAETDGHSPVSARDVRGSSAAAVEFVSPAGHPDVVETETNQRRGPVAVDASDAGSDNSNRWSDTPVVIAMDDELRERQTETIPQNEVESKGDDSISHLPSDNQRDVVSEACLKNADSEEEPSTPVNLKTQDGLKAEEETPITTHLVSENPKEKTEIGNSMRLGGQESERDHIAKSADTSPLEAVNRAREVSDTGASDEQTKKQGSVWNNIKSLAEGIMNFWRKG